MYISSFRLNLITCILILATFFSSACATNHPHTWKMDAPYPHDNIQSSSQRPLPSSAPGYTDHNTKGIEEHFLLYCDETVVVQANGTATELETQNFSSRQFLTYNVPVQNYSNNRPLTFENIDNQQNHHYFQPHPIVKARIDLETALIRFNNISEMITDENAFNLFHKVSHNLQADPNDRALADYCIGHMCFTKRTDAISDEQAITMLSKLYFNNLLSIDLRMNANELVSKLIERVYK